MRAIVVLFALLCSACGTNEAQTGQTRQAATQPCDGPYTPCVGRDPADPWTMRRAALAIAEGYCNTVSLPNCVATVTAGWCDGTPFCDQHYLCSNAVIDLTLWCSWFAEDTGTLDPVCWSIFQPQT